MRLTAILNRDGGTLRTTDIDAYCQHLEQTFRQNGHKIDCRPVKARDLQQALTEAFSAGSIDAVVAAGGDGTISAAGAMAFKTQKPFGVIPAGTMNLFARSLSIPMEIHAAADALALGTVGQVDVASANGQMFMHQFSVGFHPRIVRTRSQWTYSSRFGKIRATVMAALDAVRRPPVFPVRITLDGKKRDLVASSISVSNNRYGEGHLPYADRLDEGTLGFYFTGPVTAGRSVKLLADMTLGTWRTNPDIDEQSVSRLVLEFPRVNRRSHAVIDGELMQLPRRVELLTHQGALPVILPGEVSPK